MAKPQTSAAPALLHLPIAELVPDPDQPRRSFDEARIAELAESIRQVGLVQPIAVRPLPGGGHAIVAGERRWRAHLQLAATDDRFLLIPAVVQARDDRSARLAALVENVLREGLNPIDRADALQALRRGLHTTWQGVAERTGLSPTRVKQLAGLTTLRREVRQALADGALGEQHARAIKLLGGRQAALGLAEYLRARPDTPREHGLAIARLMKQHEGLGPHDAAELLRQGHPKARLRPLPPPLDLSRAGRTVAALKGLLKTLDELAQDPIRGAQRVEVLQLLDQVNSRTVELRGQWLEEFLAE